MVFTMFFGNVKAAKKNAGQLHIGLERLQIATIGSDQHDLRSPIIFIYGRHIMADGKGGVVIEFIILIFAFAVSLCLPVKCYTDNQFKMKCLEMHGNVELKNADPGCTLPTEGK